jgi:OmpA-OmpF porin, OOP family
MLAAGQRAPTSRARELTVKLIPLALAAAAAAGFAPLASAALPEIYIGGTYGATEADLDCTGTLSCENDATGGKLFGGYRFGNGFAIEGMAYALGETKATFTGTSGLVNSSVRSSGVGLGVAVGGPASEDWTFYARIGIAQNSVRVSASSGALSASSTEKSTQPYVGLSVGYRLTRAISLDLAFDSTKLKVAEEGFSIRTIGLGMTFAF